MIRPISDLPALVGDAALMEVEGADGNAYQAAVVAPGGIPFPDNPDEFGTVTADDEEWDGPESIAARGWTVEADVVAPSTHEINTTFAPSRLRVNLVQAATTNYLSIYRTPTEITLGVANFAVDFDASGGFTSIAGANSLVGVGVRDSAAGSSPGFLLSVNNSSVVELRKYSNIGTGAFTSLASANFAQSIIPFRLFVHLDRQGTNFAMSWSADGVGGHFRTGIGQGVAQAPALLWMLLKRDNLALAVRLANNWVRWNRYYLTPP